MSGILSRIPTRHIVDALHSLPDPEIVSDGAVMDALVEILGIGRVRITARRMRRKRGRSTYYFWTAGKAETVA